MRAPAKIFEDLVVAAPLYPLLQTSRMNSENGVGDVPDSIAVLVKINKMQAILVLTPEF